MQFKPSDFLAWVGIVSGGLIAMKKPKKVIGWFLIIASGCYLLIAAFTSDKGKLGIRIVRFCRSVWLVEMCLKSGIPEITARFAPIH